MSAPRPPSRSSPSSALAAATLTSLPLGSIYAYSVLLSPLETLLSVSRSELASVFGISILFFTLGANLSPRLFGLLPLSVLVLITMAIAAAGVLIAAMAETLLVLIFGYGVLFAIGGGLAYVVVQQSVNAASISRPGLVNGYLVSLFPLGAMIAAPAFGAGIHLIGVRLTLTCLAATVAVSGLIASWLIARSGVRLGRATRAFPLAAEGGDVDRSPFIKLFTVFFLAASSGLMVMSQAAGMVAAYGASTTTALYATTGITAAIAAARLLGGILIDRFPIPLVAAGAQATALAGATILTIKPSAETAILTLGAIGVGYGLVSGVTAGAVASYWPKHMFGRIASRTYIAWCLAALTLPVLAARLFDLTGGYQTAVMVAGGANLAAVLVALTLPRQKRGRT